MVEGSVQTVISVRGEARDVVAPDSVAFRCTVSAIADGAVVAREQLVRRRDELSSALSGVGSVVATVDNRRDPLTHLVHAVSVGEYWDNDAGGNGRRRDRAAVSVVVTLRDFDRLPSVLDVIVGRDGVAVSSSWDVDEDNPAWTRLRADAVAQAVSRARDYAAALGGSLAGVAELADGGLLTGGSESGAPMMRAMAASGPGGFGGEELWLDPVPQEIRAIVEARCVAGVPPLSGG